MDINIIKTRLQNETLLMFSPILLVFHTILQDSSMHFMPQKYLHSYILKTHHWFRQFSVGNTIYEKKGTDIAIINSKVTL